MPAACCCLPVCVCIGRKLDCQQKWDFILGTPYRIWTSPNWLRPLYHNTYPGCLCSFLLRFIDSFESRVTEKVEYERDFLVHFPNVCNSCGQTIPKQGARNSIQISQVGGNHLVLQPSSHCFRGMCFQKAELEGKVELHARNQDKACSHLKPKLHHCSTTPTSRFILL